MNLLHLGSEYPRQESHLRRELRKLAFFLLNYGDERTGTPCRGCTGARGLEDRRAAVTPMTRKEWWLLPESRRPLLLFREALISLS